MNPTEWCSTRLQRSRFTCQNLYFVSQSFCYGGVGISGITEISGIDSLAIMNLDRMKAKMPGPRPRFESASNAHGNNRDTQFVCQDCRAFSEFGYTSIDRTCTFGENQEHSIAFQSCGSNLHCANEVCIWINRDDVTNLCKPPGKCILPVVAVAKNEDIVNDSSRQRRN